MANRKRRSARSGRPPLLSPGRPPVAGRNERRRFWAAIAAGMASEDAAVTASVPQAIGTRWFRKAGGMPPAMFRRSAKPLSGRYLSLAEREELAILRGAGRGSAGDRPADGAVSVDDLAGVATQCRDAQRGPGLSGNHSAVACGPGRSAPKACEAGDQRGAASVCAGSISRRGRNAAWGCGSRSGGVLERSPTRTSAGSAVGLGVEPGADCPSLTARLPAR